MAVKQLGLEGLDDPNDPEAGGEGEESAEYLPGYASREEAEAAFVDLETRATTAEASVTRLDGRLEQQGHQIDRILETRPPAGGDMRPVEEAVPNFGDPVADPEGFQKNVGEYVGGIRREFSQRDASQRAAADADRVGNQLWADFKTEHPEYEGQDELVRGAYLAEMADRGLSDASQLPAHTRAGFSDAVKARCDRMGGPRVDPDAEGGEGEEANRSGGVAGGSGAGARRRAPANDPTKDTGKSLSSILAKQQEASGY